MRIRGLVWVSLILLFFLSGAHAYTVVFKSGRTLQGTLVSETATTIQIKDASGVEYSLKKSLLNMDRMSELNTAQAVPATPAAPPVPSAPPEPPAKKTPATKGQKVFTNADIPGATPSAEQPAQPEGETAAPTETPAQPEAVPATPTAEPAQPDPKPAEAAAPVEKPAAPVTPVVPKSVSSSKKQGKVFTNEDVVPPEPKPEPPSEDSQTQPATPAAPQTIPVTPPTSDGNYVQDLKAGATQLSKALQDLSALTDGIAVNWEVASSTGNDSKRSVRDYMTGATASAILNNVSQQLNSLQALQAKLSAPPAGMEQSYQIFSRSVDSLKSFYTQVQQYDSIQNVTLLKSRLTELSSQINSAVSVLESSEVPKKTA